jgi:hypothetical protein
MSGAAASPAADDAPSLGGQGAVTAPGRPWRREQDQPYLDEPIWNRIWACAVADSGIPFKPTAYQLRHTHASWLIDAGENPKAVMHRLGQADLRTTARYVHVLDETGESAARRFAGLLPPLSPSGRRAVRGRLPPGLPVCAPAPNLTVRQRSDLPMSGRWVCRMLMRKPVYR